MVALGKVTEQTKTFGPVAPIDNQLVRAKFKS
jgi:hypothetical protein